MIVASALHSFSTDLRYAFRMMRKHPRFTAAAVTILAVGIGVNAIVFTVTNAVLFNGFRLVERNDRILYLGTQAGCCVSYPDFEDWRNQAASFEGMVGAVADLRIVLGDDRGHSETYTATRISANGFSVLGQKPLLGRDFAPADEQPGAEPVAILGYGFWQQRYGRDPAIVGRTVRINTTQTRVVGVMPEGFSFPQNQEMWVPLVPTPDLRAREARDLWFAFGRLADGVSIDNARAEMATIGHRLAAAYPRTNQNVLPVVQNFHQFFVGPNAATTYGALWGAVGFVLLIACANLANLLLARSMGRSREISVRIALGASRWRIIRQLLIESVTLSALGGAVGWWIAKWGVRAYEASANPPARSWSDQLVDYSMNYDVLAYCIAISIGTGLLFGLAPAFRLSKLDVNSAMKNGGRGVTGGRRGRSLSELLVIAEVALAIVLLVGAGVMVRSFLNVYTADLGFRTDNVVTALVNLPEGRYPTAQAQLAFFDRLKTRLEARPGVDSLAIANVLPGQGSRRVPFELEGAPAVDRNRRPTASALVVSTAYFQTLGTAAIAGRAFNDSDGVSGVAGVIVNQRFATTYWQGEDPLGKRLRLLQGTSPEPWLTVVGVFPNMVQNDATRQKFDPLIYMPYAQKPAASMWVLARARIPQGTIAAALRTEIRALDSELSIWLGPFSLAERLAGAYWSRGLSGALFGVFAAIALLLASVGLYAVIEHSVSQRTREIGIRIAVGATAHDILRLVFMQGMLPLGIGLVAGLVASFAVNRVLTSQLVQVSSSDPVTYVVSSVVLIVAAMLGCLIPARRAMGVDPLVALRDE